MNPAPDLTRADFNELQRRYKAALAVREDITWPGAYPKYPAQISELMHYITDSPWGDRGYDPSKTKNTLKNLSSADLPQIRSVLTEMARCERFCMGCWEGLINEEDLPALISRADELIPAK